jgi:ankyrin repeat protein
MAAAAGRNDLSRVYRAITKERAGADQVRRILDQEYGDDERRKEAVNYTFKKGNQDDSAIRAAFRLGRDDPRTAPLIGLLLAAGADPSELRPLYLSSPIALAIAFGQVDALRVVLKSGRHDANEKIRGGRDYWAPDDDPHHCSPVHFCLVPGSGAPDVNMPDPQLACLEVLVREFGADVNSLDSEGEPPLSWIVAMRSGHEPAVELLLSAGADPAVPIVRWCQCSNAYRYFQEHAAPCVRRLVEAGAPASSVDENGRPLLSIAAATGKVDLVRYLIGVLQRVDGRNLQTGQTALHVCSTAEVAAALLDADAELIESKDGNGRTPVFAGAQTSDPALLELLLERGASPDVVDAQGSTPMMAAYSWNGERQWHFTFSTTRTAEVLLRRSSRETLRATRHSDGLSAADCIVKDLRDMEEALVESPWLGILEDGEEPGPDPPLHELLCERTKHVLCALLEAGAPVRPENADAVLPVLLESDLLRAHEQAAIEGHDPAADERGCRRRRPLCERKRTSGGETEGRITA